MLNSVQTTITDPREAFILSHIQWSLIDKYESHPNWFFMISLALVIEKPMPKQISSKIDPRFHAAVKKSYAKLFEYAKVQFHDMTYADFQKSIAKFLELYEPQESED